MLKSKYIIIRVSNNNDVASRTLSAPDVHPQVEHVMQIDIRKQRRNHRTLRGTHLRVLPFAFLQHSGLEPFLDQPKNAAVASAMFDEPQEPIAGQIVEKAPDVTVQNPVHLLPRDPDVQRIQRLMLAAPWPKTIRETPKILFINLIEDRDHGLLDNFVLQCRDPKWPLPAIRFRNVYPSRRLRSISAAVHPAVQI